MTAGLWLGDTGDPTDDEMKGDIEDELFGFRPSKILRTTEPAAEPAAEAPATEFKAGEQPSAELDSPDGDTPNNREHSVAAGARRRHTHASAQHS